jgi:hypothetical protein
MNADIIFCILGHLSFCDIMRCCLVSKQFNHVSKNGLLWKKMSEKDYPTEIDSDYARNYMGYYKLYNFLRRRGRRYDHKVHDDDLDLSMQNLKSIPPELCLMADLKELVLRDNELVSLPVELGRLTNLTSLKMSCNKLESIPSELCSLPKLRELYLHKNNLRSLPVELGQLTTLIRLDLEYNKLESMPLGLSLLTNLKMLCVDERQLQFVPPSLKNAMQFMVYDQAWLNA